MRVEIEDRRRPRDPDRDIACILEINFPTNQDIHVFGCGIEKFQPSAIALEDDTTARLSEIEPSPAAGGQLSVPKLNIANDARADGSDLARAEEAGGGRADEPGEGDL